jgi:hypothetical protein
VTDNKGQLLNQFVDIAGTVIVPTHISVIVEHIEPKSDFIA